jgi:two-component system OmpR family response regulator
MRVLLVEDDYMIGAAVQQALRDNGYGVDWVINGATALDAISTQSYELVLLDLGLPGRDGMSVLAELRKEDGGIPVVILTAHDSIEDRVAGLDGGADDYLVKPFVLSELMARMRAVTRRQGAGVGPLFSNGVLTLDPSSHECMVGAERIKLTGREFALLHALMLRPGAILSRSELEERIYGWNEEVESNAVEFLIHSLRKKLGSEAIKNVRGVGWMVPRATR